MRNQSIENILQRNIEALQKASAKGEKLDIGKLTNGLSLTIRGELKTGRQKTMQLVSFICKKLFSALSFLPPKALAFIVKPANTYQQKLHSKVLEYIRGSAELAQTFHVILDVQGYHPQTRTEELSRLKADTNFDRNAALNRTDDQKAALTNMQNVLKRAVVDWIIDEQRSNNDSLASVLTRTGYSEPMELSTLAAQLPALYAGTPSAEIIAKQQKLLKSWIKLEVGHEWGIDLTFSSGNKRLRSTGAKPSLATGKAALLVSDFMNSGGANAYLSPQSQQKVIKAALSGSESANKTNALYHKNNKNLEGRKANRSTGEQLLRDLNSNNVVTIPTGWFKHAVGMTLHKAADGKYFLYYCNRGERGFEKTADRALMANHNKNSFNMVCFEIGDPRALTPELLGQIASAWRYHSNKTKHSAFAKPLIEGKDGIHKLLKLTKVAEIPKTRQKVGNCTWANCKGSIHAALIAAAYDEAFKPGQSVEQTLDAAVKTGTKAFKSMERFGRKEGLKPLLAYNALNEGSPISAFDHLRFLSAAARKLDLKILEIANTQEMRNEDQSMRIQVADYFKTCSYPVSTLNHALMPISKAALLAELLNSRDGSYTFIDGECHAVIDGNLQNLGKINLDQSLKAFLLTHQRLTLPVFLKQPRSSVTQEKILEVKLNLKKNVDQRKNRFKLNNSMNEAQAKIKDPNSTDQEKADADVELVTLYNASEEQKAKIDAEVEQILNIELPGVAPEIKETVMKASKEFTETRLKLENEIANLQNLLDLRRTSLNRIAIENPKLKKLNFQLKQATAVYNNTLKKMKIDLAPNFEKDKSIPDAKAAAKVVVALLGKAGELITLSKKDLLTIRVLSKFEEPLNNVDQAFPPA